MTKGNGPSVPPTSTVLSTLAAKMDGSRATSLQLPSTNPTTTENTMLSLNERKIVSPSSGRTNHAISASASTSTTHSVDEHSAMSSTVNTSTSKPDTYIVYCDGACKGNGQVGAIAGVGVWWGPNDSRLALYNLVQSYQTLTS